MTGDEKDKEAVLQGSHVHECYQTCLPNDMHLCKRRNQDVHFSMERYLDFLQQVTRIEDLMCYFSEI